MKYLLLFLLTIAAPIFAADIQLSFNLELTKITFTDSKGKVHNAGTIADVWANYPQHRAKLKDTIVNTIWEYTNGNAAACGKVMRDAAAPYIVFTESLETELAAVIARETAKVKVLPNKPPTVASVVYPKPPFPPPPPQK